MRTYPTGRAPPAVRNAGNSGDPFGHFETNTEPGSVRTQWTRPTSVRAESVSAGAPSANPSSFSVEGAPPSVQWATYEPPELEAWLKGLDSASGRSRKGFKFSSLIETFEEFGWERLDDLLHKTVTDEFLVSQFGMKQGLAQALLRFAAEDASKLEQAA